jgi:NAD-reducing hydrogenase small subunit
MKKPRLATCSLTGCFGCHMSLLDIDERLLELMDLADLDRSPLDDKKTFDCAVDVGFIEGGCSNESNVYELREFRKHCRILVAVGVAYRRCAMPFHCTNASNGCSSRAGRSRVAG